MQRLEVSGAVRHIYVIRRLKVNELLTPHVVCLQLSHMICYDII
jgi:hypothetical protein